MDKSKNAKLLTGITKIHITPESGRVHMTFSKPKLKTLKKLSIDLEISIEDVIDMAIDLLSQRLNSVDIDDLSQEEIKTALYEDNDENIQKHT